MKINGVESSHIMTVILEGLYRKAADPSFQLPLPIKVISSADVAKTIFLSPELFVKNYEFMEALCKGRVSSNGDDWKARTVLTQSVYSQATNIVNEEMLVEIYSRHLQAYSDGNKLNLNEAFIDAALEAISRSFGLTTNIPWPSPLVNRARSALVDRQAMAWIGASQEMYAKSTQALQEILSEFEALWLADQGVKKILDKFDGLAQGISNFSATEELLQNLLASAETSASSLLWAIETLARNTHLACCKNEDDDDMSFFLDEVSRLFPAFPFVTRTCLVPMEIEGVKFLENEPIIISILGVHTDPQYWDEPLIFRPKRQEFVDGSYHRQAYIPFLSGPRACAGMKLAKREIKCGIRAVLKAFSILPCEEPRRFDYGISFRPAINLEKYLERRTKE